LDFIFPGWKKDMIRDSHSILLFSYFKGHGDGLHVAWSKDGFTWLALNGDNLFVRPEAGIEKIMRDPFVLLGQDGLFHLVWTSGWREKGIGYASSANLTHWSQQKFIPLMEHEPYARNCWAPEIFYDAGADNYIIYWATSIPGRFPETDHQGDEGLNHRMYYVTTRDFKTFRKPRLFFDGGFDVIDANLVKDGDRYLLFMKNETSIPCEKNIRFSVSNNPLGGFNSVSPPITGNYWAEGPSAIKLLNKQWVVYFDKYKLNRIGAVMSDDLTNWTDISDQVHFPSGAQHGSVFTAPAALVQHLL
jgi:hypothetical protein